MNEATQAVSTRAVLALVFAVLATAGWCPCVGSLCAIALGMGSRSAVGRAGFHLGWISLALTCLGLLAGLGFLAGAALLEAFH